MNAPSTTHLPIDYTNGAPLAADDPRAAMARSVRAARTVIAHVDETNAASPTPCPDWSALDVARHIVAVLDRAAAGPTQADLPSMPILADVGLDDLDAAALASAQQLHANWTDDRVLDTVITVPWGDFPGAMVIGAYASETIVHTWDLAVSLGLTLDWPERDLAGHLAMVQQGIPESPRDAAMPFGAVVRPPADAPAIEHLVGWLGRDVEGWRVAGD